MPINDGGLLPDFAKFKLDMSDSTGEVLSASGSAILTLKLLDTSTVSTQFQWVSADSRLELADPFGLEAFISSYADQIDELSLSIPPIEVAVVPEANTIVAEVTYESAVLAADTTSWYESSGGCEGIFPDVQLCP